jgi:hypothetical protein
LLREAKSIVQIALALDLGACSFSQSREPAFGGEGSVIEGAALIRSARSGCCSGTLALAL